VWFDLAVSPEERKFASGIVKTYLKTQRELDEGLVDVTDNWRLERIGAIERSVLRLGAAELEQRETPPRVVIQEAVRLAERFGSSSSARFVNGVLDAYARRAGVL
jgi:N utilization substance protein B